MNDTQWNTLMLKIESLGYGTVEYYEAMAFLFTIMARSQWKMADQARTRAAQQKRREDRRTAKSKT